MLVALYLSNINPLLLSLQDVKHAEIVRYAVKDDKGNSLEGLKIIEAKQGYLGIYGCRKDGTAQVKLAESRNLLDWKWLADIDDHALKPGLKQIGDGFLIAYEHEQTDGNTIRLRHYTTKVDLLAGKFDRQRDLPRTLSQTSEGSPTVVTSSPDLMKIELAFHYRRKGEMNRLAGGRLDEWYTWQTWLNSATNKAFDDMGIDGDVGDRDLFAYGNEQEPYFIHEVQYRRNDVASTRIFVIRADGLEPSKLNHRTAAGSTAFTHPTLTFLKLPNGKKGYVATLQIPKEGAARGEAGCLIYARPFAP